MARHDVFIDHLQQVPLFAACSDEGTIVAKDSSYGEVESVKAVSDLIAPLSGEVLEVNQAVIDAPELVNEDCYGKGWMIVIAPSNPAEKDKLLSPSAYGEVLKTEAH